MTRLLRWIGLLPACIVAWYAALACGLLIHGAVERLCPAEQMVSGECAAPWFLRFSALLICAGAALAASLVVIAAYFVAPSARVLVARLTLLVGACMALWLAVLLGTWFEFASAIAAGAITTYLLTACRMA